MCQWLKPLKINFPKENSYKQIAKFGNNNFQFSKMNNLLQNSAICL